MKIGESKRFDYTGNVQEFYIESTGVYKLECYGARGGNGYGYSTGGAGGYISCHYKILFPQTIYCYVGQIGNDGNTRRTSFNGGAIGGYDIYGETENGGSGGGSTDFRIRNNDISTRILVAGGGGGAGGWYNCNGKPGGPSEGSNGILLNGTTGINNQSGGGGGGGGYYGGKTNESAQIQFYVGLGAYGGTSYAANSTYNVTQQDGVNSSNGYAILTLISIIDGVSIDGNARLNSDFYNDPDPVSSFDFEKLFTELEV